MISRKETSMKTTIFLTILSMAGGIGLADTPGWFNAQAERVEPGQFASGEAAVSLFSPLAATSSSVTTEVDDSDLVELARGLQHDPVRIFNHVHDHIEYTPYFGLLKGAQQTLLERNGNDFDQAALLFRLLEISGFSPVYGHGTMTIPRSHAQRYDMASWLRATPSATAIGTLLANGGIPYSYAANNFLVDRVWVEVEISGTLYKLDPAFKRHHEDDGLDASAMTGYSRAALLAAAGGAGGANDIRNMSQAALFSYLDGLATNLLATLHADHPNASMDELLGDHGIIPEPMTELPTALRFAVSGEGTWTEIPEMYYHTVSISHDDLDMFLKTSDIAGRRLSVTYAPHGQAAPMMMSTGGEGFELFPVFPPPTNTVIFTNFPDLSSGGMVALADPTIDFGHVYTAEGFSDWGGTFNGNSSGTCSYDFRLTDNTGGFSFTQGGGSVSQQTGGRKFTVRFSGIGQTRGTKTARLMLGARPAGSSSWQYVYYNLTGRVAVKPELQLSGYNSVQTYYGEPVSTTFTLHNNGILSLTLGAAMTLSGGTPARFSLTSGHGAGSVAAGGTRPVTWRYDGAQLGSHSTNVRFGFTYDGITYNVQDMLTVSGQTSPADLATIWLDDEPLATETGTLSGRSAALTLSVNHPYAAYSGTYADQTVHYTLKRGGTYAIVHGFGGSETGLPLERRRRKMASYLEQGFDLSSRQIQTESLNLVGQGWMEQTAMQQAFLNRLAGIRQVIHHRFGLAAQEEGCYVDVKAQFSAGGAASGNISESTAAFKTIGMLHSAMEHSIIEQAMGEGNTAASTVKLLALANAQGVNVHIADASNFSSVSPLLSGYSANDLSALASFTADGGLAILPENGSLTLGQWNGRGYIGYGPEGDNNLVIQMIISGNYGTQHGGYSAYYNNWYDYGANVVDTAYNYIQYPMQQYAPLSFDPVNLATGSLLYDNTDITLGGSSVRGLALARHYTSAAANADGPLGYGWTHAYDVRAVEYTDYKSAFGQRAPRDATPMLVASTAILDLLGGTGGDADAKRWMCAALVAHWATEYVTRNAVSINVGDQSLSYVKRPGGDFEPPPGVTLQLAQSNGVYRLTERSGTERAFNAQGRLSSVTDADGNALTLAYNAQTNLTTVTDHYGRTLSFTYANGRISSVSDGTGRSVAYAYTADGDLSAFTDPENNTWLYTYDTAHRLVSVTDPEGLQTVHNTYDPLGRVKLQSNGSGDIWDFRWADFENKEIDPTGHEKIYYFDAKRRQTGESLLPGLRAHIELDGQDHPVLSLDVDGNPAYAIYDAHHNVLTNINALGETASAAYDARHNPVLQTDALGNRTTAAYDHANRPTAVTNAAGGVTRMEYHPSGPHKGLLWRVTDPDGGVTAHAYDAHGNPSAVTFPDGTSASRTYNARGDLLQTVDAQNRVTSVAYDKRRLPVSVTAPDGSVTSNRYDAIGRQIESIDPLGRATRTVYTPNYTPASVTLPDGSVVSNLYDALDNLVAVRDARGATFSNAFDRARRQTAAFDAFGNRTAYAFDNRGNTVAVTNALGQVSSAAYDAVNRPINSSNPLGHTSSNVYDAAGQVVLTRDPLGRARQFRYDPLGRSAATIRPSGATDAFGYDGRGNQTAYTNSEGRVYTMAYDIMGRLIAATNAAGQQVFRLAYTPAGDLASRENGNGQVTEYGRDPLGRVVLETSLADGQASRFAYDAVGGMVSASNAVALVEFARDAVGGLTSVVTRAAGTQFPVTYGRDAGGLVTNTTYAAGKSVSRTFDLNGRLTSVTDWQGNAWTFAYDAAGRETGGASPGGVTRSLTYDAAGRISGWSIGTIMGRTITRDAVGQRIRDDFTAGPMPTPANPRHADNTFDAADRPVSASVRYGTNAPVAETFAHDLNGALTNWVSQIPNSSSLITNSLSLAYNALGQMSQLITSYLSPITYSHDALGNRIKSGDILFIPDHADPRGRPLTECLSDGTPVRYYIWGPGRLLGFIDADGTLTVAHGDEYGNVIALTSENGAVLHTALYGPHGEDWGTTGDNPTPFAWLGGHGVRTLCPLTTDHCPLKLYLTTHRLYSSTLNRFLSPDPLGLSGGLNLYQYAEGNPLAFIDPLGLSAETYVPSSYIPSALPDVEKYGVFSLFAPATFTGSTAYNEHYSVYTLPMLETIAKGYEVMTAVAGFQQGFMPAAMAESAGLSSARTFATESTIWSSIKATQPVYEGTVIPRSFELATQNGSVWVHGNATKHMAEYAISQSGQHIGQNVINLNSQLQLTSLQGAVNTAISKGVPVNQLINVGGWGLKFGAPRQSGQLPTLIHALPLK